MLILFFTACLSRNNANVIDPHVISQGRSLFAKHITAIGGSTALKSHHNLLTQGKIRTLENEVDLSFKTYHKAPNQILTVIAVGKQNISSNREKTFHIKGFDGVLGWESSPEQLKKIDGSELSLLHQEADFYAELNHEVWYPHLKSISEQEFAGRPSFRLRTENHIGEQEDLFFDQESDLLLGKVRFAERAQHAASDPAASEKQEKSTKKSSNEYTEIWMRFGHYVLVEDIKIPFSLEWNIGGISKLILLEEASWDLSPKEKSSSLIAPFIEPIQFPSSQLPDANQQ